MATDDRQTQDQSHSSGSMWGQVKGWCYAPTFDLDAGQQDGSRTHLLDTYVWLRRYLVLVTGFFLTVLILDKLKLLPGSTEAPCDWDSISAYYYYRQAGVKINVLFIGCLFAAGLLLLAYQGYNRGEKWLLNLAGICLIGVAYFPMDLPACLSDDSEPAGMSLEAKIHYGFAVSFFALFILIIVFFAKTTLRELSVTGHDQKSTGPFDSFWGRSTWNRMIYVVANLVAIGIFYTFLLLKELTPYKDSGSRGCFKLIYNTIAACIPLVLLSAWFGQSRGVEDWLFWVECFGVGLSMIYWCVKSLELEMSNLEESPSKMHDHQEHLRSIGQRCLPSLRRAG